MAVFSAASGSAEQCEPSPTASSVGGSSRSFAASDGVSRLFVVSSSPSAPTFRLGLSPPQAEPEPPRPPSRCEGGVTRLRRGAPARSAPDFTPCGLLVAVRDRRGRRGARPARASRRATGEGVAARELRVPRRCATCQDPRARGRASWAREPRRRRGARAGPQAPGDQVDDLASGARQDAAFDPTIEETVKIRSTVYDLRDSGQVDTMVSQASRRAAEETVRLANGLAAAKPRAPPTEALRSLEEAPVREAARDWSAPRRGRRERARGRGSRHRQERTDVGFARGRESSGSP